MTDEEAIKTAHRAHKVIQDNPALKLLFDLAKAESHKPNRPALEQFIFIGFDLLGVHIEEFEKLKN